jgi:hypothetical protein
MTDQRRRAETAAHWIAASATAGALACIVEAAASRHEMAVGFNDAHRCGGGRRIALLACGDDANGLALANGYVRAVRGFCPAVVYRAIARAGIEVRNERRAVCCSSSTLTNC